MEHPIKKTPPVSSFFNNHKEQPSFSETPMIVREMMIYNRQLVEENVMLASQVKSLEMQIQRMYSDLPQMDLPSYEVAVPNHPSFEAPNEFVPETSSVETENVQKEVIEKGIKKVRAVKKGTQIYVDPAIATMFSRQLKDSGYRLADVCRAMMLIAVDRPRYRNMIFDRVKSSERISPADREVTSFAFTYPEELGNVFTALIRVHKIKQYEFFEQVFKEFVQSYAFRKLLPEYIHKVKTF